MKKIITTIVAVLLVLLIGIPAYAAETVSEAPGSTDISVYAKYVDNTGFTVIPIDNGGNGSVTLPDGTEITVRRTDDAKSRIVVEEVTDRDVLDWIAEKLGSKADGARVFYVYQLDESRTSKPTNDVAVTITAKDDAAYSVHAVSNDKTGELPSAIQNGAVTFTTDGSSFYALCKASASTPGNNPLQTGDTFNLMQWTALLCVSSVTLLVTTVAGRRRKRSV